MAAGHALVMWVGEGVVAVVVRLRCNKSAGGPQTCCIDSVAGIKSMLQQPNTKSETDFFDVRTIFCRGAEHRHRPTTRSKASSHACLRSAAQMKLRVRAHHRSGGLPAAG